MMAIDNKAKLYVGPDRRVRDAMRRARQAR
jgi:hypothetical protein